MTTNALQRVGAPLQQTVKLLIFYKRCDFQYSTIITVEEFGPILLDLNISCVPDMNKEVVTRVRAIVVVLSVVNFLMEFGYRRA